MYSSVVEFRTHDLNCESEPRVSPVSGVARAFPGGRGAHPESQNEEENEKSLRKNKKK